MDNPAINEQRSINVATVTKAVEQERTRRIEEDLQHSISTNEERKKKSDPCKSNGGKRKIQTNE